MFFDSMKIQPRMFFDLNDPGRGPVIFFKGCILQSVHESDKNEICLGFLFKIYTKSLRIGGVKECSPTKLRIVP